MLAHPPLSSLARGACVHLKKGFRRRAEERAALLISLVVVDFDSRMANPLAKTSMCLF